MEALFEHLGPFLAKLPTVWAVIILVGMMLFREWTSRPKPPPHDPMSAYSAALSELQARVRDIEERHTDHESRISFMEGQSSTRNPRR